MKPNDTGQLQSDERSDNDRTRVRAEMVGTIDLYDLTVTVTEYELEALELDAEDPDHYVQQAIRDAFRCGNLDEIWPTTLGELRERLAYERSR